MLSRTTLVAGLIALLAAKTFAAAPTNLGTIALDLVAYTNNDGTFEWKVDGGSQILYTYCMSTNNIIGGNPQIFNVWYYGNSNAAEVAASGMLASNSMPGLTASSFLEASAYAQSFGGSYGITATDDAHNAVVHSIESSGDVSWDGQDYSQALYLEQANPNGGGQPQLLITPEPGTIALMVGAAAMLGRRRKKATN